MPVGPPPLDTSVIGLFCYFKPANNITLSNCLAALVEYTQYSNYIDGKVRCWDSHNIGSSSPYDTEDGESAYFPNYSAGAGDTYLDVRVRIRADGWILAWMLRADNREKIIWWSDGSTLPRDIPTPTTYGNRLGRAIQIIMSVAGISGFVWADLQYWDYEYVNARRLYIFGKKRLTDSAADYYYVTVPNGVTVYKAFFLWIARLGNQPYASTRTNWCRGYVDDGSIYDYNYSMAAAYSYCWIVGSDITSLLTVGVQHSFKLSMGESDGTGGTLWTVRRHGQAVVVLTS